MRRQFLVLAAVAMFTGAEGAGAQVFTEAPTTRSSRGLWGFDIAVHAAQPVHEFRTQVGQAWGFGASVRHHFRRFTPLGVRGDFSFLNYGNERKRVPLSSTVNRVLVDMNTTNNIIVAAAGPELAVPSGPIRPYVYGFAGYSYFFTQSSAGDDNGGSSFASTTNFQDGGLATGGGGGVRIPLRTRSTEISIDGGARFTRNGLRSYLRSGDITDLADGSLQFTPRETVADFWQYHLGISFSRRR